MEFKEKYSLLELIEDADATIYVATEIPTGKGVVVFLFPGEQARAQKDVLLQLRSVNRLQFPELIDIGDDRGTPFVVTQPIGGLSELKARLSRLRGASPISPNSKYAELPKAGAGRIPDTHASTSGETGKIPVEPQAGQPTSETSGKSTAGSFTQMFQAASPPVDEAAPEISGTKPPRRQSEPGSFTQMFEAASPPIGEPSLKAPKDSPPTSAASQPTQAGPGEFTRFFNAASATKPAPEPQKRESQDEFAHLFRESDNKGTPPISATSIFHPKQSGSLSDPTPRVPGPQSGEFTRIFGKTSIEDPVPVPVEQIPAQSTPEKDSPGEYTRVFSAQPLPQESGAASVQSPVSAPETAVPPKSNSLLVPILIGVILLLLAVLTIVVFALLE
ncbi:MAG: hypothetical protein JXR49_08840 [Acidobacteria bacterium]|nr:hypothetical protein [Acidobacteriota bacterium]